MRYGRKVLAGNQKDSGMDCADLMVWLARTRAVAFFKCRLEAPPGIEPGCADLQSVASPLRHGAPHRSRNRRICLLQALAGNMLLPGGMAFRWCRRGGLNSRPRHYQ